MVLESPKLAIKSETFLLSDYKSRCLIFMEIIVYFEKKFAMSL